VKTIAVVAEDKVGLLADISYILAKSKINIESINVAVVSNKAVIALEVSNPSKSKEVLEASGYKVESNSLVIKMKNSDVQGLSERLLKDGVKVEKSNTLTRDEKFSVVSLTVDKPKRASTLLQDSLISNEPTG
jgi:hypothetical protein